MKKFTKSMAVFVLVCAVFATNASAAYREPESKSFNGYLDDGTSIFANATTQQVSETMEVTPRTLLGYQYVEGYERLIGKTVDYVYDYVYATSTRFVQGAAVSYTLTTTKEKTKTSAWNINGNLSGEFDIKMVQAEIAASGGYEETDTVTITVGEEWNCEFTEPGLYELTWYMRGHRYYAQCGATIISTGTDHGKFAYCTLGLVTFPTDEVHFDVTRVS